MSERACQVWVGEGKHCGEPAHYYVDDERKPHERSYLCTEHRDAFAEIGDAQPLREPAPWPLPVSRDEWVRVIQEAEVTDKHLRAYAADKFDYRAGMKQSQDFGGLSMVEAIILWWEMEERARALNAYGGAASVEEPR